DANHNQLNAWVLTNSAGGTVIQVESILPDADYYIRVRSAASYGLTADFTTQNVQFTLGSTGGPTAMAVQSANLSVLQSQVLHFTLATTGTSDAAIAMTIRDANNAVILTLISPGGSNRSASVFLSQGTYRVDMSLVPSSAYLGGDLTYNLSGYGLTDPVGV